MEVYTNADYGIKKIEFCCEDLAYDILLNNIDVDIKNRQPIKFFYHGKRIDYCFYCGEKIVNVKI